MWPLDHAVEQCLMNQEVLSYSHVCNQHVPNHQIAERVGLQNGVGAMGWTQPACWVEVDPSEATCGVPKYMWHNSEVA